MQLVHVVEGAPESNRLATTRVFASATRKLLILSAAVLSTLPAFAQVGKLDPAFGHGGLFVIPGSSALFNAPAAAIQVNEEILVGGGFNGFLQPGLPGLLPGVARLKQNGALDKTFGTHGAATTTLDSPELAG
jgi:hypothetical protein